MAEKRTAWTVPGPVADDAYKGTAAANPVLVLSPDAAPVRAPYYGTTRTTGHPEEPAAHPGGGAAAEQDAEAVRDTRSPAQIEADLTATRSRLSDTLDELQERLSPRTLARQTGRKVKGGFVDPDSGRVRRSRAALAAGAAGAVVAALAAARALRHRS